MSAINRRSGCAEMNASAEFNHVESSPPAFFAKPSARSVATLKIVFTHESLDSVISNSHISVLFIASMNS